MSSAGQAIGYVVGAVVGYFTGGASYVLLGAAIGGAIGGALDPPKGPKVFGPRLDDLSVQTSTYGAPIGRAYGTVAVTGNVFWLEGDKLTEHTKTENQGGKGGGGGGGGGSETTTYSYSATFAVGLLHVTDPTEIVTLRRLWIDTTLVYDASATDINSTIASMGVSFTFFPGADEQIPHPRMQADKGAANVSGYPGLCYIVLEDLDLSKYSNTLVRAQIKAELSISPATSANLQKVADLPWASGGEDQFTFPGTIFTRAWGSEYTELGLRYSDSRPMSVETYRYTLGEGRKTISFRDVQGDGWTEGFGIYVQQSDVQCAVFIELPGYIAYAKRVNIIYPSYTYSGPDLALSTFATNNYYAVFESGVLYLMSYVAVDSVGLFTIINGEVATSSGVSDRADAMGYSSSYIFCARILTGPDRTVLTRYDKTGLSINDQFTFNSLLITSMQIIDDDHAYFSNEFGYVYFWSSGSTPTLIGQIVQSQKADSAFSFCVANNASAVSTRIDEKVNFGSAIAAIYVGAMSVPQQSAALRDIVTAECELASLDSSDLDLTSLTNNGVRGYKIANPTTPRDALTPLQAAFPFDVAQSSYKVRFISRGAASVATVPEYDLGASEGNDKQITLLPVSREMDSQLHSRVSIRYIDPEREYDIGEQYADRPETASVAEWVNDLPIVMVSSEASQVADILLSKEWVERREFGKFSLPPTYSALEPGDIITVNHRGQAHTLRITRIEYTPDGRLLCSAKQTSSAAYVSTATGFDPLVVGQSVVVLKGTTAAYLLDIPRIRSEQDDYGLAFGLLGKASGWPGGLLLRSDDSGNNWVSCGALNARAAVFTASGPMSSHHGYSPDFSSMLTVTPETPGAALYSVTEEQFYSESNLAAYGVDGRWEILAFRTATSSSGTFIIKDFLRGLYGSEANGALHSTGDLFIVLDTTTIAFAQLPTNALGVPRLYRPVTQGGSAGSENDITDTYDGVNLMPLSPVDLSGARDPLTLDWTIAWSRRSRWPVELFSGVAVPLGESSESYDLEIFDSGYSTLKRGFYGLSSSTTTYSIADQTTDFGGSQILLYLRVFQNSATIGRGLVLQGSISHGLSEDPYLTEVTVLMHMDDVSLTDYMGSTVTVGTVTRSATQSVAGGFSSYYNGSNYLIVGNSSRLDFGTGDFTIELSHFFLDSNHRGIFHLLPYVPTSSTVGIALAYNGTQFVLYCGGSTYAMGAHTLTLNTWYHFAVVRSGTSVSLYVNGSKFGASQTDSSNILTPNLYLGMYYSASYCANGYQDELEVTKAARYSGSSFFPRSTPYPNP